jgi:hypothetical protein
MGTQPIGMSLTMSIMSSVPMQDTGTIVTPASAREGE